MPFAQTENKTISVPKAITDGIIIEKEFAESRDLREDDGGRLATKAIPVLV
jgi:hypothetical protein